MTRREYLEAENAISALLEHPLSLRCRRAGEIQPHSVDCEDLVSNVQGPAAFRDTRLTNALNDNPAASVIQLRERCAQPGDPRVRSIDFDQNGARGIANRIHDRYIVFNREQGLLFDLFEHRLGFVQSRPGEMNVINCYETVAGLQISESFIAEITRGKFIGKRVPEGMGFRRNISES